MFLARLIPRMCHTINRYPPPPPPVFSCGVPGALEHTDPSIRPCVLPLPRVVYVFGSHVKEPPADITPTFLTTGVLSTLRQADFVAHSILRESGRAFLSTGCGRSGGRSGLSNVYVNVC